MAAQRHPWFSGIRACFHLDDYLTDRIITVKQYFRYLKELMMYKYLFILLITLSPVVSASDSFFNYLWHTFVMGIPGEIHREGIQLDKKGTFASVLFKARKESGYRFNFELIHRKKQVNEFNHFIGPIGHSQIWGIFKVKLLKITANDTMELLLENTIKVKASGKSNTSTHANIFHQRLAAGNYQVIVEQLTNNAEFANVPAEFVITTERHQATCGQSIISLNIIPAIFDQAQSYCPKDSLLP